MSKSETCEHEMREELLSKYFTREIGIPVFVNKAVKQSTCALCGEVSHSIPYLGRLIAAAAVSRAKMPEKLSGREIVFMRKSLELSGKELASILEVTPETVSRWENDKAPMNPAHEKMLRICVGIRLGPKALAVDFNPSEVFEMNIRAIRSVDEIVLELQLVAVKEKKESPLVESYSDRERLAA